MLVFMSWDPDDTASKVFGQSFTLIQEQWTKLMDQTKDNDNAINKPASMAKRVKTGYKQFKDPSSSVEK